MTGRDELREALANSSVSSRRVIEDAHVMVLIFSSKAQADLVAENTDLPLAALTAEQSGPGDGASRYGAGEFSMEVSAQLCDDGTWALETLGDVICVSEPNTTGPEIEARFHHLARLWNASARAASPSPGAEFEAGLHFLRKLGYQTVFNSIGNAVDIHAGNAIGISVEKFINSIAATGAAPPAPAADLGATNDPYNEGYQHGKQIGASQERTRAATKLREWEEAARPFIAMATPNMPDDAKAWFRWVEYQQSDPPTGAKFLVHQGSPQASISTYDLRRLTALVSQAADMPPNPPSTPEHEGNVVREGEPVDKALAILRNAEWSVAVHNDYRLNGKPHTFWLFTHPNGRWIKGEGETDQKALEAALAAERGGASS